ncbi:PD-(D/E)XK motif protein [uncultured Sutterella sp.]|uniref:PD-(D/E)XK motif protein n=1 Tax=uncultured Sutterella sp. TaxID=286133 RepID=UPI0025E4B61E|nr:PD-(D/E)XK motif protein [uncultured Sutterella sp.]
MMDTGISEIFRRVRSQHSDKWFGTGEFRPKLQCMLGMLGGRPSMLVISPWAAPELKSSAAVSITTDAQRGGSVHLFFTVTEQEYEELFSNFCADLLSVMEAAPDDGTALSRLASRYETWRAFWKNPRRALTEEKARGLAGELIHFLSLLREGRSPEAVSRSWTGPDGGDQDFVLPDGWAEVKTIRQSSSEVQISSLEQLANPDDGSAHTDEEVDGRLVVIRLHDNPAGDDFMTLRSLYDEILGLMEQEPHARLLFTNNVEMVGADMSGGELENKMRLKLLERSVFAVNKPGFPRIIRNDALPPAVTRVRYSLSLPALEPWRVTEESDGRQV